MSIGKFLFLVIVLALSLSPIVSFAQGDGIAGKSAKEKADIAKKAFNEGRELFQNQKYLEAASAFRRAMEASPSWKIFYNIGHSEAAAKHYGLALEAFELYVAEAGDELDETREKEVFDQIAELRKKVGKIVVTAPNGAVIIIDDVNRGTAPETSVMRVAAGKVHSVLVKLDGEVILEQTTRVWGGEEIRLEASVKKEEAVATTVATAPKETAPAEGPAKPEPIVEEKEAVEKDTPTDDTTEAPVVMTMEAGKHPLAIVGAISLGVGLAGLATGGVSGIIMIVKSKKLDENCDDKICETENPLYDSDDIEADLDMAKTMAKITTVALPVGGAIALTGIVLYAVGKKLGRDRVLNSNVSLVPVMSPEYSGMMLEGRF